MKKIFTFMTCILMCIGMQAVDQIAMGKIEPFDAEKMHVAEGNVITFDVGSSWVGGQYWFGNLDLSAYDYLCVEIEDCQGNFAIAIDYQDNTNKEYSFSSGTTQVTFKLHSELITKLSVKNTSNDGGTLDIGNLYAGSAAEFETALDLGKFSGNYDATTHVLTMRWGYDSGQWWFGEGDYGADYSEYVNFVVEFVEANCGGYVVVEYNNSIAQTQNGYSAGATSVSVPIREEGASSVKKIYISGDTEAATITLGAAYFVRDVQTLLPQYVTKDLDLSAMNEGWNSTYDADAKAITFKNAWGACGWWMARDLSDYSKVVAEFSEPAPANGVLKVLYSDGTDGEQGFNVSATKVEYELTNSKTDVNEIYLQLAAANTLKIERIYLVKLNDQTSLSLAKLEYGWSSDYDAATKTISFTSDKWGARGWNIDADCSDYTRVIVTFAAPTTVGGVLKADYGNDKTNEQGFEAGATSVELVLDNSLKSYVKCIFLSTEFSGTSFEIASATFSRSAMTEGEYGNYHRVVTSGDYGTICLPYGAANYLGMTLYEIAYRDDAAKKIYLDEATTMQAGMPYIFHATSDNISVTYDNTFADYAHGKINGLYGIRNETNNVAALNADKEEYIIYENEISKCGANCGLRANRAYIIVSDITTEAKAPMPGRRRVGMGYAEENAATGVENINGGIAPMQEGTYDIMGRQVTEPTAAGFYIVNGKKVLVVK